MASTAFAQTPAAAATVGPNTLPPAAIAAATTIPVYTLADCIRIAKEKQPALAASRASLAAKQAASAGIQRPSIQYLFVPDIQQRRQQSLRGVSAAEAELLQAEIDTAYAVTRTYYTAIYARLQYDVAADVLKKLEFDRADLERAIKEGVREFSGPMLDRLDIAINLAKAKQLEAEEGMKRALAALREAMGVSQECFSFQLADLSLPEPKVTPERCDIINAALARRGEMIQTLLLADVVRLEIDAQGKWRFRQLVRTFASAADIHSQPVPPGIRNGDYRPGAIGPEMPTNLAGPRSARLEQANAYSARADAVVAKTRELITLEAEDGFCKWEEASKKVSFTRSATAKAHRYIKQLEEDRANGAKIKPEELTTNRILATQAAVAMNDAMFQQVLALANLERITAGGFHAGFTANNP
jgi:outer membrane protein TolC